MRSTMSLTENFDKIVTKSVSNTLTAIMCNVVDVTFCKDELRGGQLKKSFNSCHCLLEPSCLCLCIIDSHNIFSYHSLADMKQHWYIVYFL